MCVCTQTCLGMYMRVYKRDLCASITRVCVNMLCEDIYAQMCAGVIVASVTVPDCACVCVYEDMRAHTFCTCVNVLFM